MSILSSIKKLLPKKVYDFFTKGNSRSLLAKKNIATSLLIKPLDFIIGIILVPLVLNYLDQTNYGIWLTMVSIVSWFSFMNIGLGHGLRNKFAEAKARGDHEKAKIYVSTTYAILSIIVIVFFSTFIIINNYLPWNEILNVNSGVDNNNLSLLALIIFGSFSFKFVLELISTIILANQKSAISDIINLSGRILVLVSIYVLTKSTSSSLIYLALAYTGFPILVLVIATFYFYNTEYKMYVPSIKYVRLKYSKDLLSLGFKFFFVQIAAIIMFSTDNIIISHLFTPKEVTPYNITFKLFSYFNFIFIIVLTPFWSAFTEAFQKNDLKWIRNSIKKLHRIALALGVVIIIVIFYSDFIFNLWVGSEVIIPFSLVIIMGGHIATGLYFRPYNYLINGVGKIKLQMLYGGFGAIVNIPLSILFAKNLCMGITGVYLATIASNIPGMIILPIQARKIISGKASGIWNK